MHKLYINTAVSSSTNVQKTRRYKDSLEVIYSKMINDLNVCSMKGDDENKCF